MTVIINWMDTISANKNNSHFDDPDYPLLTPSVVILPDAKDKWARKKTTSIITHTLIKPFYDDRYKTFRLNGLKQITSGSIKHRIWIGKLYPKFNPEHEGHIARLEFKIKRELVQYLQQDECLTDKQKQKYLRVGYTLVEVFGKTIFNTMLGETNE
jgi:hypothetical protein